MEKVLLLNLDYQPIKFISWEKAMFLVFKEKVRIVEESDKFVHTVSDKFNVPLMVVLKKFVKNIFSDLTPSRKRIFQRDNNACVYCNSKKDLTIDHLIPRSKGGQDTWENMVTACSPCNGRKGNKSLKDSGMTLLRKPYRPNRFDLIMGKSSKNIKEFFGE